MSAYVLVTAITVICTFTDGSTTSVKWSGNDKWSAGSRGTSYFYYNEPYYGTSGTASVKIYDESGNVIGSGAVRII